MKHRHLRCFRCSGAPVGPEGRKPDRGCGLDPGVPPGGPRGVVRDPGQGGASTEESLLGFWGWAWQKGSLELWSGRRDG